MVVVVFTDEDIRKILKSVDTNYELPHWQSNIRGLVARLEAAEKVVECAVNCYGMDSFVVKQWKKLAGKQS